MNIAHACEAALKFVCTCEASIYYLFCADY